MEEEKDDVIIESESLEPDFGNDPERKIAKMRAELKACQKEKQEYMDGWQRAKADYVNALKRFDTEKKAAEQKGTVNAVEMLLPAFDALERAKEHGEVPNGFLAIAKQIESAFSALGLEEIGIKGEQFDPALHEAFAQEEIDAAEKDSIVSDIIEKGWRINGIVIRPAKVKVWHFAGSK